ncbi:hypothetical protein LCGC14_1993220 [marine sediment metagenome]|uniref:Uncharacterized protein n=1 Tax=marine sediment metagenome TaxID=412755 RepID=A0A0F9HIS9_9ZZZZ
MTQRGSGNVSYMDTPYEPTSQYEGNLISFDTKKINNYLDIPLLIQYHLGNKEKLYYYLKSGVSINVLINSISYGT